MAGAVVLSLVLVAGLLVLHRFVHGRKIGFSPLAAFGAGWILALGLYRWNPIGYIPVSTEAWRLIVFGTLGFAAGYAVIVVVQRGQDPRLRLPDGDLTPAIASIRCLCHACVVAAAVLFAVYVRYVVARFGIGNPTRTMFQTRATIAEGAPTIGFYFFYFAELVVPTAVAVAVVTKRARYWWLAAGAATTLLATTGRTNATKAVLWSVFILLLLRGTRPIRLRAAAFVVAVAVLLLGVFALLGGSVGKTYHNSYIAQAHLVTPPPMPTALALPYEYVTAPLPTFSEVVRVDPHDEGGRNTFRPVFQLAKLVDPAIEPAPKVQQDHYMPYRYNVSTYLYPLWRDFGTAGVIVGSLVFGMVCARAYTAWLVRRSPATLCLAALATLAAFVASGDAQFNELSWLFQAALLAYVARRERLASRPRSVTTQSAPANAR